MAEIFPASWEWCCKCGAGGVTDYESKARERAEEHEEEGCHR